MSQHDLAASHDAQKNETQHDETRRNEPGNYEAPRGLGPNEAPWTYPQRCFEPDFHSPNLALTPLNQVEAKLPVWECCGRLRRGAVTIVAGEHGSGKSLLAVDWAARVTYGEPGFRKPARPPQGADDGPSERRPFGNLSPEDRPAKPFGRPGEAVIAHACDVSLDLLRRRIDAAGGAPERIASLALAYPDDDKEFAFDTIRRRVISLASAVRGSNNVRLLVIDNLEAWAGNYHEPPSAALLGFLLAQLTELATRAEIAILVLAQLPRAGGQAAARKLDQLTALAPVVYLAASDPERPSRKLLLPVKNNLAAPAAASFEAVDGRLVWSEAPVDATADEFVAPLSRRLEARHERETAARWLLDGLAGGPIESRELFRQARDCGISTRTLRRAAQSLGLSPHKTSFRGPWVWGLGEAEAAAEASAERQSDGGPGAPARPSESGQSDGGPGAPARPSESGDNDPVGRGRPPLHIPTGQRRPPLHASPPDIAAEDGQRRDAALAAENQERHASRPASRGQVVLTHAG